MCDWPMLNPNWQSEPDKIFVIEKVPVYALHHERAMQYSRVLHAEISVLLEIVMEKIPDLAHNLQGDQLDQFNELKLYFDSDPIAKKIEPFTHFETQQKLFPEEKWGVSMKRALDALDQLKHLRPKSERMQSLLNRMQLDQGSELYTALSAAIIYQGVKEEMENTETALNDIEEGTSLLHKYCSHWSSLRDPVILNELKWLKTHMFPLETVRAKNEKIAFSTTQDSQDPQNPLAVSTQYAEICAPTLDGLVLNLNRILNKYLVLPGPDQPTPRPPGPSM